MGLLAFALWLGTSVLGFLEILTVREIVLRIYTHFAATGGFYGGEYWTANALGIGAVMATAIVCVAVTIGGGEYHLMYFGQSRSWRLFGWTISVQLTILLVALFV